MTPQLFLVFLSGCVVGGGLFWLVYGRGWQQRAQQAEAAQQTALQAAQTRQQKIYEDMAAMTVQMRQHQSHSRAWQQDLATAEVAISDLQNRLKKARYQASAARGENQELKQRLTNLATEARQWQENWQQMQQRSDQLRADNERLSQKLAGLTVSLKQLQTEPTAVAERQAVALTTSGNGTPARPETAELVTNLKRQVTTLLQQVERMDHLRSELAQSRQQLATAEAEIHHLQDVIANEMAPEADDLVLPTKPYNATTPVAETADDLMQIDGIGHVYSLRLYEAGITTFAALAALPPATLTDIIDSRTADVESWIAQAKELSAS